MWWKHQPIFFQMLFKTADEIKNFAERMKKIGAGMIDENEYVLSFIQWKW